MDSAKKQHLLNKQAEKYKTMDSAKKQDLLNKQAEKCKTMDAAKKQDLLNKQAEKYETMDIAKKEELLQKQKQKYCGNESKGVNSCINTFKKKNKEGPYYICCVCNRMLFKKSVLQLISNRYPSQYLFKVQISFDGKIYICNTCHSKAIQGKVPCRATVNNLCVDDVPTELESLKKLEQIIIAQQIVFEKNSSDAQGCKGQQRKIKGVICNVPVDCDQTCNISPHPPERSGIVFF